MHRRFVEEFIAQAVQALETREKQDQLLQMADRELLVELIKRVRNRMHQFFPGEVGLQIEDIFPQSGDFAVLCLGQIPHQNVHPAAVCGKIGGDLLAQKDAGQVGDFQRAIDGVVVGERDDIHAALAQQIVKRTGLRVAVGEIESPEQPIGRAVAEAGVQVEVGLHRKPPT